MPTNAPRSHWRLVYHILNRANAWMQLFAQDGEYQAFERVFTTFALLATGTLDGNSVK